MYRWKSVVGTVCCCGLLLWAASRSWGFEEGDAPVGLRGVFPASAPDGLSEEDFEDMVAAIDPTWKEWMRETGQFVKDFYEGDHPTIEDQRAALGRLHIKLRTMEKALDDPRYRSIFPQISELNGRLHPRVDLADVILETMTMDPETARQRRLQPAFAKLRDTLAALRTDLANYQGGGRWLEWTRADELHGLKPADENAATLVGTVKGKLERRESYVDDVRNFVSREPFLALEDSLGVLQQALSQGVEINQAQLRSGFQSLLEAIDAYEHEPTGAHEAQLRSRLDRVRLDSPDGGALVADVVGANYLNYNLRVRVSEGLLNRFFSETREDSSPVNERVMQAYVSGYQRTNARVTLDLQPSTAKARFAISLNGTVRSNTNGYAEQATVHTVGTHVFSAKKPVLFDGQEFTSEPATASVRANNQTVGASTQYSGVPIFGRIANNIAIREANSMSPQTNALAASKISSQVREQLDQETDEQFSKASKELQTKTYGPLRKYDLYPDAMTFSSTDGELRISTRLMASSELGGARGIPVAQVPVDGMVAQVHESLLTNGMDRMGLAGKTMTEDEVRKLLEDRFSEILGRKVEFPKPQTAPGDEELKSNTLVFDEHDPVRFTIADGAVTLYIRAGMKRSNGEDIPVQIISVPFTPTLQDGKILLTRGNVGVKPVASPPSVSAQVARAQIMRQKIQSALPEQTIDATFEITQNGKKVQLQISDLLASAGWLSVMLR